jgi:hypothetical protein
MMPMYKIENQYQEDKPPSIENKNAVAKFVVCTFPSQKLS